MPLLAALNGCSIADGPKDLASDVFDGSRYRLESPGNRLLEGQDLRVSAAPLRQFLLVSAAAKSDQSLTFVDPGTGSSCSLEHVLDSRFLFDVTGSPDVPELVAALVDGPEPGTSQLHFLDAHCAEPIPALDSTRLPERVLIEPVRYLLQQGADLVTIDALSGARSMLARDVTWFSAITEQPGFASRLRFVELQTGDRFQLLGPQGETLLTSDAGTRVIVPAVPDALSALLLQRGESLSRVELRAPYWVPVADDVCFVSPDSDPYLPVVRACSGETSYLYGDGPSGERRALPDSAQRVAAAPQVALALYTRSSVDSERNDVSLIDASGAVTPVLSDAVPHTDLWSTTSFGTTVEGVVGDDATLTRHYFDDPQSLALAAHVYRWPGRNAELPLIADFDGTAGSWLEISGFRTPSVSVVAEGVVPEGGFAPAPIFAPGFEQSSLSEHGYFAFLRNFKGGTGELVLAHRPASSLVLALGWSSSLAHGVAPYGFRWAFDGAVLLYIDHWQAGAGELHVYRPDLDLDQLVATRASTFSETSTPPGVAYTVPSGSGAGLWHARLK